MRISCNKYLFSLRHKLYSLVLKKKKKFHLTVTLDKALKLNLPLWDVIKLHTQRTPGTLVGFLLFHKKRAKGNLCTVPMQKKKKKGLTTLLNTWIGSLRLSGQGSALVNYVMGKGTIFRKLVSANFTIS